jgi:hypothetical protein
MPMPYTLAKGPILAALEDVANPSTPAELARLQTALGLLRDPSSRLGDTGLVPTVGAIAGLPPLDERLEANWFGRTRAASGDWVDQPAFGGGNVRTGYFRRYYGDVEAILKETCVRAVELAFGIDHGADLATATRQWAIELLWKCPNPWFEGWVTWRRHGPNPADGQVTVIVATPGEDANPVVNVVSRPPQVSGELLDPTTLPVDHQGMWVVTHHTHVKHSIDQLTEVPDGAALDQFVDFVAALFGLPAGRWTIPLPTTTWEGTGVVDVVHVPEEAGGSPPFGTAFA